MSAHRRLRATVRCKYGSAMGLSSSCGSEATVARCPQTKIAEKVANERKKTVEEVEARVLKH